MVSGAAEGKLRNKPHGYGFKVKSTYMYLSAVTRSPVNIINRISNPKDRLPEEKSLFLWVRFINYESSVKFLINVLE